MQGLESQNIPVSFMKNDGEHDIGEICFMSSMNALKAEESSTLRL